MITLPPSRRMAFNDAIKSSSEPSSLIGRAAVGAAVSSTAGKTMPAVFASIYYSKADRSPQKLKKKYPIPNLTASLSGPPQRQREAAPTPYRVFPHKPNSSAQEKSIPTEQQKELVVHNTVFELDAHPAYSSSSHPFGSQMQRPRQVRHGSNISTVQAELPDSMKLRRPNGSSALPRPVCGRLQLSSSSPSTKVHFSPLHSKAPLAMAGATGSVRRARNIQRIMGKKYVTRLSRMSILPALSELPDEEQSPTLLVTPRTTALPLPPPRPVAPVNVPDVQRSQSQQLKARNSLAEFADKLIVEKAQMSLQLRDAVSHSVIFANQLEQQKQDTLALKESLQALWSLAQPGSTLKTVQICEQVKLLAAVSGCQIPNVTKTIPESAVLEQKLIQQSQQVVCYKSNDAASRQLANSLVHENKHMKSRLDKVEAERLRLQASLHAAEVKLERIERSLYVYPSSAQEILSGTAASLSR
ncbi:hypothetical protein N0V82_005218 [Gnomoniopsis sp. IMI 355080]|nr:hypothetical protein N0V82_005218 [Gnomoniopsis sp. IMI 355080]